MTKDNRDPIRNNIKKQFFDTINTYGKASSLIDKDTARPPIWKWFPELNDEFDFIDYH